MNDPAKPAALLNSVLKYSAGIGLAEVGYRSFPALSSLPQLRRTVWPYFLGTGSSSSVALTFDDGPDPKSTPLFIEELDRLGVKATFFVLGEMAERYPYSLRELVSAGHEIALHGNWHRNHLFRSARSIRYDMERSYATVSEIAAAAPIFFRPPYGVITRPTLATASQLGLRSVLWGTWGRDWRKLATPSSVMKDLKSNFAPGCTVLLHDSDCTSYPGSYRATLAALPDLAELCAQNGLKLGPLANHGF